MTLLRVGLAAAMTALVAGCGRAPFNSAAPADVVAPMEAAAGAAETATVTMQDLGRDVSVAIDGQHFRTGGAYTVNWSRAGARDPQPVALYPSLASVTPDGKAAFYAVDAVGRFGMRRGDVLAVYYHPDGDPAGFAQAERVLTFAPPSESFLP